MCSAGARPVILDNAISPKNFKCIMNRRLARITTALANLPVPLRTQGGFNAVHALPRSKSNRWSLNHGTDPSEPFARGCRRVACPLIYQHRILTARRSEYVPFPGAPEPTVPKECAPTERGTFGDHTVQWNLNKRAPPVTRDQRATERLLRGGGRGVQLIMLE